MKKIFTFIMITLLFFKVVYAKETIDVVPANITISQDIIQDKENQIPVPDSMERKNIDGKEYIIKHYKVKDGFDKEKLIEQVFEEDGFIFHYKKTNEKKNETTLKKEIGQTKTVDSKTNSLNQNITLFAPSLPYESEGYTGTMYLDAATIGSVVKGHTTKSWTSSTTKEYTGLMYADQSYVPGSIAHEGNTLPLINIDWVVTETGLAGDSLVPTQYKAVAYYSKSFSKKVPTGYTVSATYQGEATKTTIDSIEYSITYEGTPSITITEEEETSMKEPIHINWKVINSILGVSLLSGGGILIYWLIKSRRGVRVYNLMDSDYVQLGIIQIDKSIPIIDLNHFEDILQSKKFNFILDKYTIKMLFGKTVAVTLDDVTIMHMIKGHIGEYKFSLDMGGLLDEEK